MTTQKSKFWAIEAYWDSWPTFYEDLLSLHVPFAGIIHNRDVLEVDSESGEVVNFKKEHAHVILEWEGPTTANNVREMLAPFPVPNGHVERVNSFVGMCRYLLHLDNPEKAQYEASEIFFGNGGFVTLERPLTEDERKAIRAEVRTWVRETWCTEYADLIFYAADAHPEWLDDVENHSIYWGHLLASMRAKGLPSGNVQSEC